ncbi:MAG TPA: hypothetical protein VN682_04340 [Terriglobales bacterium]|nr:hypothetical protein [Terriglobales bacterium]
MRRIKIVGPTALLLLLAATAPAYARQDQQEHKGKQDQQAKPEKQQQDRSARPEQQQRVQQQAQNKQQQQQQRVQQQAQNKQQQQQQRVQQQAQNKQQQQQQRAQEQNQNKQQRAQQQDRQRQQRQQQDNRSAQQRRSPTDVRQQQVAWQSDRAHSWQSEHRTWQQRGGYSGYRIPDDRFRSSYGQNHEFRIDTLPVVFVGGRQRFQYGGYWFGLVDPWPEYWSDNWYDNDDVYVAYYGNGYYLCDRRYPEDRIAISFYLD